MSSSKRVSVVCPNCQWDSQRAPKLWEKPCPKCSTMVVIAECAENKPIVPPRAAVGTGEAMPVQRSLMDGLRRARQEISEPVRVNVATMRALRSDPSVRVEQRATAVLEEWAAKL